MGGIAEVLIAPWVASEVKQIALEDGIVQSASLPTGGAFKRFLFPKNTGSMTSTYNINNDTGVNYVSTELSLFFNRMETAKRVEMTALAQSDLLVIVKDNNGKYWLLGKDEPVRVSAGGGETGAARADRNGYPLTLVDNSQTLPYEVDEEGIENLL